MLIIFLVGKAACLATVMVKLPDAHRLLPYVPQAGRKWIHGAIVYRYVVSTRCVRRRHNVRLLKIVDEPLRCHP